MPTTREELDRFHQFAIQQISRSDSLELDDLVTTWMALREQFEISAILDRGIAEMEAGNLGRDAFEVSEELARNYGILES